MIKLLNTISFFVLVSSGILFLLSGILLLHDEPQGKINADVSVIEKSKTHQDTGKKNKQIFIPPLVKQATAFALYLNPPPPPTPKKISRAPKPVHSPPPVTTPKFRLLSTSYYRSSPEKSLALVSEPGKGDHWIGKGERIGNFVVEMINKGSIIYRAGNQSHEMKLTLNVSVQNAQIKSIVASSTRNISPNSRLPNATQSRDEE